MDPRSISIGMLSLAGIAALSVVTIAIGLITGADLAVLLPALKDIILVIVGGIAGALTISRRDNNV